MHKTGWSGWHVGVVSFVFLMTAQPQAAMAAPPKAVDQLWGSARAQALDLHLLGRRLGFGLASTDGVADRAARTLNLSATGTGTRLSPRTTARAGRGRTSEPGGRTCFQPAIGELLARADLPQLIVGDAACGGASADGDTERFEAVGTGHLSHLRLKATQILAPALRFVAPTLKSVGDTPVGEVLRSTDDLSRRAVASLDGFFDQLLGSRLREVPGVKPSQTINQLVASVDDGDLFRMTMGHAAAKTMAGPAQLSATAETEGGVIEVLPAFRGPGTAPLFTIVTAAARAAVTYDRETAIPTGITGNSLVRVESDLLPSPMPGHSAPVLPVRPTSTSTPAIELAPGQRVDLLCDTPSVALCSTISVGQPRQTRLPGGGLRVESAAVSVHLFKNLDRLVPGSKQPTALDDDRIPNALNAAAGREGLTLGEPSSVVGVRLDLAEAVAEAGGTSSPIVPREEQGRELTPSAPELPRTGSGTAGAVRFAMGLTGAGVAVLAAGARRDRRRRRTGQRPPCHRIP